MARPQRCRRICAEPAYDSFSPGGISGGETVVLTVDEYEVIRLVDYEKKTHEQCGALMDISRTTVTEMYENARYKIADSLVNGKELRIAGGNYRLCCGAARACCQKKCRWAAGIPAPGQTAEHPQRVTQGTAPENSAGIFCGDKKGDHEMRVAVTYDNGTIFQHFGHTEEFKLYDIENNEIVGEQVVPTMGSGHGALAGFLAAKGVDALICGGIGGGAQNALAQAGIRLFGGVSGSADEAVRALIAGNLGYNPDVHCSHHAHEHSCGEHRCGEDKQGCAGN